MTASLPLQQACGSPSVPPAAAIGAAASLHPLLRHRGPRRRRASPGPVPPASEDEIRLIEETLADQHLYHGPLDGQFTVELRDAVRQYQRRKGLRETALLDPETMRRLDADASGDATYGAPEIGANPAG